MSGASTKTFLYAAIILLTLFDLSVKSQIPPSPKYEQQQLVARDRSLKDNSNEDDDTIFGWHMWMGLPRYLCIALPSGEPDINIYSYLGPGIKYWLEEPTYHHWLTRWDLVNHLPHPNPVALQQAKVKSPGILDEDTFTYKMRQEKLYFTVDVTGIRNMQTDRVLKGWFHLKIQLAEDDSAADPPGTRKNQMSQNYVIDRIVVGARGLQMMHRNPGKAYSQPDPLFSWVWGGGIGLFVKDGPQCGESRGVDSANQPFPNIEESYVHQQFLSCSGVSYREALPGNNFIYIRTNDVKYGPDFRETSENIEANGIHLNFRLHHSFCNFFYKVDFVVVGIAVHKDVAKKAGPDENLGLDAKSWKQLSPSLDEPDKNQALYVEKFLSTRITFADGENSPVFYENADSVPRFDHDTNRKDGPNFQNRKLECNVKLKASLSPPDPTAEEAESFYGSIKKIGRIEDFELPIDVVYHELLTNVDNNPLQIPDNTIKILTKKATKSEPSWDILGIPFGDGTCIGSRSDNKLACDFFNHHVSFSGRCQYYDGACEQGEFQHNTAMLCDSHFNKESPYFRNTWETHPATKYLRYMYMDKFLESTQKDGTPCDKTVVGGSSKCSNYEAFVKPEDMQKVWLHYYFDNSESICDEDIVELNKLPCPMLPPRPFTIKPEQRAVSPEKISLYYKNMTDIQKAKINAAKIKGMGFDNPAAVYLWDTRVCHGVVMTVLGMFVVPVNFFLTRYYKETFMDKRMYTHHIWFFVHLMTGICMMSLSMIGLWRQRNSRKYMGVSYLKAALTHRLLGWFAVALSFAMVVFGGIRVLHQCVRAGMIVAHSFIGYLIYIFIIICMITCLGIPGCPASQVDASLAEFDWNEILNDPVFICVVFWIFFDFGMHVTMTAFGCYYDKKLELNKNRLYLISPMPVLQENFRFDSPGRLVRIILLWVYVLVAGIITVTIITFILLNLPSSRGLGPMTCSHPETTTEVLVNYECGTEAW